MKNDKRESDLINEIKELFEAVTERVSLTEEEKQFLEQRRELETREDVWTLGGYTRLHDHLKKYGLEDKLMDNLEPMIKWTFKNRKQEFLDSEFYERFKNHEAVRRAEMEYDGNITYKRLTWLK